MENIETTRYKLKSIPEKIIIVPVESAKRAEKIVDIVLNSKDTFQLNKNLKKDNYLSYSNIFVKANKLVGLSEKDEKERLRLEDEIYIRSCIRYTESKFFNNECDGIIYLLKHADEDVYLSRKKNKKGQ